MFNKRLLKAIDNLADALDSVTEMLFNLKAKSVFHETIDGKDTAVQKALGITPAPRKKYRGTYTDEQSISSRLGRKVKRSELKDAANELGVAFIQDETNHHVYVKNTCLDIVLNHLKKGTEA